VRKQREDTRNESGKEAAKERVQGEVEP